VTIDSDLGSSQWQQVDALANKFPDKQKAIDSINAQLQKKGLDWERDVKPALGPELDVVMLDLAHPNETVGLLQPKDQGAFERLVKKGNKIDPSSKLLFHQFHGWTVVSDKQATIDAFERASDSAKHTLSADKTFSSAMGKAGDGILRAYVNGPRLMAAARNVLGPDSSSYFKKLGTLDWLLMSVRAKSDGIAWDTTVHGTPGKQGVTAHGSDGSLQKLVPKDALLYLAFHGAKGMLSGLGANPVLQQSGFKGLGGALGRFDTILQGENALYVRAAGGHVPEVTFIAAPGHCVDGAAVFGRLVKGFSQGQGLHYANVNGRLVVKPADVTPGSARRLSTSFPVKLSRSCWLLYSTYSCANADADTASTTATHVTALRRICPFLRGSHDSKRRVPNSQLSGSRRRVDDNQRGPPRVAAVCRNRGLPLLRSRRRARLRRLPQRRLRRDCQHRGEQLLVPHAQPGAAWRLRPVRRTHRHQSKIDRNPLARTTCRRGNRDKQVVRSAARA